MSNNLFPETETIRALSWNQPFASLMLHGKIETRSRPTKVRGKVLICSCKNFYRTQQVINISGQRQMNRIDDALGTKSTSYAALPNGYAVAIADLVDSRPMTPADEDKCFVSYRPGLWCWVFANVQAIEPFSFKGKQGWSIISDEVKAKIKVK